MNALSPLTSPWTWLVITLAAFSVCALLPLWITDDVLRRRLTRLILVPVSIVLMFYCYPVGIEWFRRFAVGLSSN